MSTVFTQPDKRVGLDELASHVKDGDLLAVGGGLSSREPMALLRAVIRAGRQRLQVVGSAHGIDIDLLCGAGVIAKSLESYVGFEQDFGMAPNYRRACESGAVEIGAHPTACYPFYAYDRPHTALYYRSAKAGAEVFRASYLAPYVLDCRDHADYLERIGAEATRSRLRRWRDGSQAWQEIYAEA